MKHAGCGGETRVLDVRVRKEGQLWRRRHCPKCNVKFETFEITDKVLNNFMEIEKTLSELDLPLWAVTTFKHVVATRRTYAEAVAIVNELNGERGRGGLTIVTTAAAERETASRRSS